MENLQSIVHTQKNGFPCENQFDFCSDRERTISFALGVDIPTAGEDPGIVFKECCYKHNVFGDLNSSDNQKNDYSSFYHQRQLPTETVDFVLYHFETGDEYDLNDNVFGDFYDFGDFDSNENLSGFLVKWKKVLFEIGEGNFKIIKRINIVGLTIEQNSITFTLNQYSTMKADKTVRIDVVMNGKLIKSNVDFTDTNWKHSLRVPGFFGIREPQFEEDTIVNRHYEKRQISMSQSNEYKFQTNLIPDCLTTEIFDFILFSNDIFMNDYNLNNHSYNFRKFGVKLASNDGSVYGNKTRKVQLNLTFNDKFENNWKRNFN